MNEKRFFHNALESDLLSGIKQKRRLDAALGRTNASAADAAPVRAKARKDRALKRWVYIPAVAVLLVLTLAIGSVVFSRGLGTEQHQAVQPTADQTPVEVPRPIILSNRAEIRLLSEIDTEGLFDRARAEDLHLSAFDEADWGWLRETRASVNDLSATASSIRWTTELRIPKRDHAENPFETLVDVTRGMPLCFFYAGSGLDTPDVGAHLVEFASPGEIRFGDDGCDWIVLIPEVCAMPQVYDQFPAALPPTGEVTIQNTMQILDRAGEQAGEFTVQVTKEDGTTDEVPAALLGTVEHTFTFDAEALLNIAEPIHLDVPLSGEYILGIHEESGFRNERVTLDGVTLDAEIHYTAEGVWVILTIKNAGSLTEAEQDALYIALSGGPDGSFAEGDAKTEAGAVIPVFRMTRAFWGSTRCGRYYLVLDPAAFDRAKTILFWPEAAYVTGAVGEEPDDNWSWNSGDGALPSLMHESKQLGCITIPLPGTGAVPEAVSSPAVPRNENIFVPDVFLPAPTPELP